MKDILSVCISTNKLKNPLINTAFVNNINNNINKVYEKYLLPSFIIIKRLINPNDQKILFTEPAPNQNQSQNNFAPSSAGTNNPPSRNSTPSYTKSPSISGGNSPSESFDSTPPQSPSSKIRKLK